MTEGLFTALLGILRTVSWVFFKEALLSDNGSSGFLALLLGVVFSVPDLLSNPRLPLMLCPSGVAGERSALPRGPLEVILQTMPFLPAAAGGPVGLVVDVPEAELVAEGLVAVGREEGGR